MKKLVMLPFFRTESVSLSYAQAALPIIDMHFHAANFDDNGPPPNGIFRENTGYPVYKADKPWMATFMHWMANPQGKIPLWHPLPTKNC